MTQWPSNSKYWPREKKNISTKDSHINAPSSFVHHSRMWKQFKCPSTAEWIHRYFHMCSVFKRNRLVISSEKAMATHSSILAWKIPWTEEPGRLQSLGSHRVGHDWVTSLSLFTFMHWRGKWQPTPVFLPGESQGWGSLVGCHLWGHTESYTTDTT